MFKNHIWEKVLLVVVVEQERFGGQITITSEVVNYPGVERTSGAELTETMRRQAERFGAEFLLAEVTGLELEGDVKTVLRCAAGHRRPSPHGGIPG